MIPHDHFSPFKSFYVSFLYMKFFELGVKIAFYCGSAAAYNKVDILTFPRRSTLTILF